MKLEEHTKIKIKNFNASGNKKWSIKLLIKYLKKIHAYWIWVVQPETYLNLC
jgi:hypothetical protein